MREPGREISTDLVDMDLPVHEDLFSRMHVSSK